MHIFLNESECVKHQTENCQNNPKLIQKNLNVFEKKQEVSQEDINEEMKEEFLLVEKKGG